MKKTISLIALALALTMTACGGTAGGASTRLTVTMTDFAFQPASFTVPAGQEITIELSNNGAVTHDFIIMKYGATAGDHFGDEDTANIYWKIELQAGGTTTATFIAPEQAGEYQVVCGISGHYDAGMVGKLVVVQP